MSYANYETKALLEERKKTIEAARAIVDANPAGLSGETLANYTKAMDEADRLQEQVDVRERVNKASADIEKSLGRVVETTRENPRGSGEKHDAEFRAFARGERGNEFSSAALEPHFAEKRALSVGTTDAGGYSVQNERMGNLHEFLKWFGSVRSYANVIRTEQGGSLPIPTVTDTANSASTTSEAGAVATTTDMTFGQVTLSSYKYVSPIVLVSIELLRDASFDIASYLTRALGVRLARKENQAFTMGTGSSQPQGCVYGSGVGVTAAATNAITGDEIIDLFHSVDKAYRDGGIFMANDGVIKAIRKLKDGNLRYLWEPAVVPGAPDTLFGKPVVTNNDMQATLATGTKTLFFGNLKEGFVVRDIGGQGFIRLNELYAGNLQVGFLAYGFHDSKVIDNTAMKHLVQA